MSATIWRIDITQQGRQLVLPEIPSIDWKTGDAIVWVFDFAINPGLLPGLVLLRRDQQPIRGALGPFTSINYQPPAFGAAPPNPDSRFRVFASGWSGSVERIDYQVVLFRGGTDIVVAKSKVQSLLLQGPALPSAPQQVTVSIQVADFSTGQEMPRLRITPERVAITPGASVLWNFMISLDIFGDTPWFPEILFHEGGFGPFQAISAFVDPIGTDPFRGTPRLIGYGDNQLRGQFGYRCSIRGADGVLAISSGDPGIDDEGELMTPPLETCD